MRPIGSIMKPNRTGQIAVIFCARRTDVDDTGYDAAAQEMDALAQLQPGYRGIVHARGADGQGITISYWDSEAAAKSWRDQPDHARIREQGRAVWYSEYQLQVAEIDRAYDWTRP